jgi:hypothetical protein
MKLFVMGDKSKALCEKCGPVSTTFNYRDVPFSDGSGEAKDILVAECDACHRVVAIPAQSTPAIRGARPRATRSIEAMLPAVYLETLDLACYKIDSDVSLSFRKPLLIFYIHQFATGGMAVKRLQKAHALANEWFPKRSSGLLKRLSLKVSPAMDDEFGQIRAQTKLSKTELLKSLVCEIKADVLDTGGSGRVEELRTFAAMASSY